MLFLVREQYLTNNGTLMSRSYAHQETFDEMKDVQLVDNFPLMNGSQFIAWYDLAFIIWYVKVADEIVLGRRTWSAVDVK